VWIYYLFIQFQFHLNKKLICNFEQTQQCVRLTVVVVVLCEFCMKGNKGMCLPYNQTIFSVFEAHTAQYSSVRPFCLFLFFLFSVSSINTNDRYYCPRLCGVKRAHSKLSRSAGLSLFLNSKFNLPNFLKLKSLLTTILSLKCVCAIVELI
jgi:hypothetical protein